CCSAVLCSGHGHTLCADRFRRCSLDDCRRASRRLWRSLWRRLHEWSRRLRVRAVVAPLTHCYSDLHGDWLCYRLRDETSGRLLIMRIAINALAGLIFGLGLLISGMANPVKVQDFLDLAGEFDPSLIFVMLGAVVVTFLGYRLTLRRSRPVLVER